MFKLLTRQQFNDAVFKRDNYKCVICLNDAKDAHHILEKKLWPSEIGGYFLENGVSLCEEHHLKAESTEISCSVLRQKANIKTFPLPDHFDLDSDYDKWGNIILPNGNRLKGEMFFFDNVQKIIKPFLHFFEDHVKYPRTYHLSWSKGRSDYDKVLKDVSSFEGRHITVTLKMDGESSSLYKNYLHARSLDYHPHPSRTWIKSFHAQICNDIPEGWRICGENLYAKHSIKYTNLESYFLVFNIWNEKNECLSWDDTKEWCNLLNLKTVPVIYEGIFDQDLIKNIWSKFDENEHEGYVIRISDSFNYSNFRKSVAKMVRESHVSKENDHWMHQEIEVNKLK